MSCRTLAVALVLLASPSAIAQLSVDVGAGVSDAGGPDAGNAGGCVPADANDSGTVDEARGCPAVQGTLPEDGREPGVDWRTTQIDQQLHRLGALPRVAPGPLEGEATERRARAVGVDTTWTVGFDLVIGERLNESNPGFGGWPERRALAASTLASLQFRPMAQLSLGVILPIAVAFWPDGAAAENEHLTGTFGDIAVSGTWEVRPGRNTRLPVGVLVAFPTPVAHEVHFGGSTLLAEPTAAKAAVTRGLEDWEFCLAGYVSIVPGVAVSHGFDSVDVSASLKLPVLLHAFGLGGGICCENEYTTQDADFALRGVVSAQVLLRIVDRPWQGFSVGVRGFLGGGAGYHKSWTTWGVGAGLEPRAEAHFGGLALRAGLLLSFVGGGDAWGVRVGVGYSF